MLKYLRNLFSPRKTNEGTINNDGFMLRSRSRIPGSTSRRIYLNMQLPSHLIDKNGAPKTRYKSNKIITAKYNLLTFIPKNLFEQFRRVANIYFLFLLILQQMPTFEVGSRVIVVFPLSIVLIITATKDAFEDYKRNKMDRIFNSSESKILTNWTNMNTTNIKTGRTVRMRKFGFLNDLMDWFICNISKNQIQGEKEGLQRAKFTKCYWKDIKVGDIVKIHKDESAPTDLLILSSSDPSGECYVETKNLDGETNLKNRSSLGETSHIRHINELTSLKAYIDTDPPSSNLYVCNGSVALAKDKDKGKKPDQDEQTKKHKLTSINQVEGGISSETEDGLLPDEIPNVVVPFSIRNVLLRGYVLKNTECIYGIVLFTGSDTRIMLNSGTTPSKRSKIEKQMNRQIFNYFVVLLIVSLCLAIGYGLFCSHYGDNPEVALLFGLPQDSFFYNGFLNFWSAIILLQTLIPISLYVSIEFVKTWQAFFIYNDIHMYSEEQNQVCIPKAWNLSDDLGQIQYIFSDKTGTLTRNVMEFKKCSINGIVYGYSLPGKESDVEIAELKKKNQYNLSKEEMDQKRNEYLDEYFNEMKTVFDPLPYVTMDATKVSFADKKLFQKIKNQPNESEKIQAFFGLLALCHTVLVEEELVESSSISLNSKSTIEEKTQLELDNSKPSIVYRAESPDEKALVAAAKDCGFTFLGKNKNILSVDWLGEIKEFELLEVIEFDSNRKRMSVLVRRPEPWKDIVLLIKGADNVILERVNKDDDIKDQILNQIREFSNLGLRTLCLAYRVVSEEEGTTWRDQYNKAQTTFVNRQELIYEAADQIEKDLILLGSTAIEDKLQEDVPDTIHSLRLAGIKVWVLTGDKMETAINIGFASQLLVDHMKIWTVNSSPTAKEVLDNFDFVCNEFLRDYESQLDDKENALVIEGNALKHIIDNDVARNNLAELAPLFQSVICCRVSPLQKAQVVHIIKKKLNALSLSIGDGANDVSMIQEADVGVAISGEEGLQASMAADYTISQFKYLKPLLLVHGHWSYLRISEMVLNFFYKNLIFVLTSFWYQFDCGFSSNLFFEFTYGQAYNLFFTSLPVIFLGFMDRHINYKRSMAHPEIYKVGIDGKKYSLKLFWLYMLDGIWQSLVCYYFFWAINGDQGSYSLDGSGSSMYEFSTMSVLLAITMANFSVGFNTKAWTYLVFIGVIGSTLLVFVYAPVFSLIITNSYHGIASHLYSQSIVFWFMIPLVFVACILPRYVLNAYQLLFNPNEVDVVRERTRLKLKPSSD